MNLANEYIRNLLLAQSTVAGLVSTRVYEGILPESPTFPAVTFWPDGGGWLGGALEFPFQDQSIMVRCWAESSAAAFTLFGAVYDDLTGSATHTVSSETMTVRTQEGAQRSGADNDLRAYFVEAGFMVGFST